MSRSTRFGPRAAILAVGSIVAAASSEQPVLAAPAHGRVVRVERQRSGLAPPQFCVVTDGANLLCIGTAAAGELVSFVDQATGEALGELRIDKSVVSSRVPTCPGKPPMLFDVTGTLGGDTAPLVQHPRAAGLRGLTLGRASRGMPDYQPPPALADQQLLAALDLDGDGKADVTMYEYTCNADGTPSSLGSNTTQCFDTYTRRGGTLTRTHQDIVELCY